MSAILPRLLTVAATTLMVWAVCSDAILTSPHQQPKTTTLCDSDICSCPSSSWGNISCRCVAAQQEVILRAAGALRIPEHVTLLRVQDCARVEVTSRALHDLRHLRRVELRSIARLEVAAQGFGRPAVTEGHIPETRPEVVVEHSNIPVLPSEAFRGYLRSITLHDVKVDTIAPFAFASLSATERIEIRDCRLDSVNSQAFKKFSVEKLLLIGTVVASAVPSRAVMDLEVTSELRLERVTAVRLQSSSLIVRGPRTVHLVACNVSHTEGEALRVSTRGPVVLQDNTFMSLDMGAFLGFSVERHTLRDKGRQELTFHNNTVFSFRDGALSFNTTAFEPRLERVLVSRPCSCDTLQLWQSQLQVAYSELSCLDATTMRFIEAVRAGCGSPSNWNGTLVLMAAIGAGILLLAIALVALCLWRRRRARGQRWVTVPLKNNKSKDKVNKNQEAMQTMGLVLPDGRTYRETELHVIVERAEPLEDK